MEGLGYINTILTILFFMPFVLCNISEKTRDCCMYSSDLIDNFCPTNNSCSLTSLGSEVKGSSPVPYIFPDNEQCQVISDSKKIKSDVVDCFKADFTSSQDNNENKSILNQIMVKAYKLKDEKFSSAAEIFGLEVLIPYAGSTWKTARFRLSNNQDCGDHCSPRCVTIQRQGTVALII